jgi:hypothetical protein
VEPGGGGGFKPHNKHTEEKEETESGGKGRRGIEGGNDREEDSTGVSSKEADREIK